MIPISQEVCPMHPFIDRRALKAEAREILRDAQVPPRAMAALYLALLLAMNLVDSVTGSGLLATFVMILITLISAVLEAGFVLYCMAVRRGERSEFLTLFDGFSFAGKVILLWLVVVFFVTLWCLLLVIPGIVAAYRYRFALYNLCENPEIGIFEAIGMSKAQTRGFKADLFILDLSFIGWNFLSSLTLGILSIYVAPYFTQTDLGYFRVLKQITGVGYLPPEDRPQQSSQPQDPFGPY